VVGEAARCSEEDTEPHTSENSKYTFKNWYFLHFFISEYLMENTLDDFAETRNDLIARVVLEARSTICVLVNNPHLSAHEKRELLFAPTQQVW
jgi:hypothetical protein